MSGTDGATDGASGQQGHPLEIEVKLAVTAPHVVRRLIRQPHADALAGFDAAGEAHVVRLTDRYLDTGQDFGRLALRGMRARLRHAGAGVVLTVKHSGEERDGVTTRVELVGPATHSLDPDRWPDSDAKRVLLDAAGGSKVGEIARARQHRLTRVLRRADTSVELSLDRVDALDLDRVIARRHELEAELLEGDQRALAELAEALGKLEGVGPSAGSKVRFALDARTAHRVAE